MPSASAKLWIVATPIGNFEDLSPRAKKALEAADLVLAEDTRRTRRLCEQCDIAIKQISSFFDHNEQEKLPGILGMLENGAQIALVSDAGTPLMADPGYRLVRACRQKGISVSPIPGPFAPAAALCAAGLPPLPFTFLGFLPRSRHDRQQLLSSFATLRGSLIFFERKDRLAESLNIAFQTLGRRQLAICRELTKIHEEFIAGELGSHGELCENLLGEITVIIGPPEECRKLPENEVKDLLAEKLQKNGKLKQLVNEILPMCPGWSSHELYALASDMRTGNAS